MKRALSGVTAAVLLTGLTGCGGAASESEAAPSPEAIAVAPTPQATPTPASDARKRAALTKAAQGYSNAYFAGDATGMGGYLHPTLCDDQDREDAEPDGARMQATAKGATTKITSVYVEGDRGGVDGGGGLRGCAGCPAAGREGMGRRQAPLLVALAERRVVPRGALPPHRGVRAPSQGVLLDAEDLAHTDQPGPNVGSPLAHLTLAADVLRLALRRLDAHRPHPVGAQVVGARLHIEEAAVFR